MNTKTMRLPPRRVLTPSGTTNKRKERDDHWPKPITKKLPKPDKPIHKPGSEPTTSSATSNSGDKSIVEPIPSNHLLAGYLAHEYLTKGTLMGKPWVPSEEKLKEEEEESNDGEATAAPLCRRSVEERYIEVAGLLKGGGTLLRGVVNPPTWPVSCICDLN